jgi:iron complex transport system substrate-binding protein
VFLEWLDPFFCGGHWNPELVHLAGGRELIGQTGARSRRIDWSELRQADPQIIFIACCGFSIERTKVDLAKLGKNPQWNALRAVKNGRVHVADGNAYFNRPGPRLVDSLEILADAIQGRAAGDRPDLRIKYPAQL